MRVVLTGASGQLGAFLVPRLEAAGHEVRAWSGRTTGRRGCAAVLEPIALVDPDAIGRALYAARPDAVLHAAAVSAARDVYHDPTWALAVNVTATRHLADWCAAHACRFLYVSTDLVFDGTKAWNREDEPARPVLLYGRTKLAAEPAVTALPRGLVARVSLLFGRSQSGRPGFFDQAMVALRRGDPQTFFADEYRTPLDYATAADTLVRLLETPATGIVHVGGAERLSRHELMRRAAAAIGIDPQLVRANRQADTVLEEPRPADVSLDTTRLLGLLPELRRPTVEEALA